MMRSAAVPVDVSLYTLVKSAGRGNCGLHAYAHALAGTSNSSRREADLLRDRLVEAYRLRRHEPVLQFGSWELFIADCDKTPQGFDGSTFDEYLDFIGTRGNFVGVPEFEMLAQLDSMHIVIVDSRGIPLSAHGDPGIGKTILLRFAGRHYDLLRIKERKRRQSSPSSEGSLVGDEPQGGEREEEEGNDDSDAVSVIDGMSSDDELDDLAHIAVKTRLA